MTFKSLLKASFVLALVMLFVPVVPQSVQAAANITVNIATITGSNELTVKVNGTAHNTITTVNPTKFHVDVNTGGISPLTPTGYTITEAAIDNGAQFILTFSGSPFSATDTSYDASHGLYIDALGVTDNAGNTNVVIGHASSIEIADSQVPGVTQSSMYSDNANPAYAKVGDTVTIAFTTDVPLGDWYVEIAGTVVSGTMQNPTGNDYEFTYTMLSGDTEGEVPFYVGITDMGGSSNDPAFAVTSDASTVTFDKTAPTISEVTSVTSPTTDDTPSYTFTTNQSGTIIYGGSCDGSDTTANSGSNTISFDPLANGIHNDCTIVVSDVAGNDSNTLTVTSFTVNAETPTLTLTAASPVVFGKAATAITAVFSEAVTGFAANDIHVSNGSISNFSAASSTTYTFTLTPADYGSVVVTVSADAAQDVAANGNEAATISVLASRPSGGTGGGNFTNNVADTPHSSGSGTQNPSALRTCIPFLSTSVRPGDRTESVAKLQTFLMSQNLFTYPSATGFFGAITYQAVKDFQQKYTADILAPAGLAAPTGFVGPMTLAKINALACK